MRQDEVDVRLRELSKIPQPDLGDGFASRLRAAIDQKKMRMRRASLVLSVYAMLMMLSGSALLARIEFAPLSSLAAAVLTAVLLVTLIPLAVTWPAFRRGGPALLVLVLTLPVLAADRPRILVTNDNGIDDPRMLALATALSEVADVFVAAPRTDRSGGSSYMPATRAGEYRVWSIDLGPRLTAWAVDGFPADCIAFALSGPLRDDPPDLVVSGINGGPNLGDEWFGSGTIGAARAAALLGVPAVAISGGGDPRSPAFGRAVRWTVAFLESQPVRCLKAPEYLTVSFPLERGEEVRGVEVVPRARGVLRGVATKADESSPDESTRWSLRLWFGAAEGAVDVKTVLDEGSIAIVAMRADENDADLESRVRRDAKLFPDWPTPP